MAKKKKKTGSGVAIPAGSKKSGTSNYLRRPGYKALDEAGNIRGKKKKKGK